MTDQDTANERINGYFDATALTAANRRRIVALADPVVIPPVFFVSGPAGNSNRKVDSTLSPGVRSMCRTRSACPTMSM